MTRPTVPRDAQSVTSTCMYDNVASYVMGQQNTVGNCTSSQFSIRFVLRLHDPAYYCENLDLYIFVLFSFIWSAGDLSS